MNESPSEHFRRHAEKNALPEKPTDRHYERRGNLLPCDTAAPLAETFETEFLDQRLSEVSFALSELGFPVASVRRGEKPDTIIATGIRDDGTKMEITITKGAKYISPNKYDWDADHEQ